MKKTKDTVTDLVEFEEAAVQHTAATEQGDYKTANKWYDVIVKSVSSLKKRTEIQQLSTLLNHDCVGVRIWASAYLLPLMESEGIRVLKQIGEGTDIHSLTAATMLSEWEAGNLKL